jgi:hypothetical protein
MKGWLVLLDLKYNLSTLWDNEWDGGVDHQGLLCRL